MGATEGFVPAAGVAARSGGTGAPGWRTGRPDEQVISRQAGRRQGRHGGARRHLPRAGGRAGPGARWTRWTRWTGCTVAPRRRTRSRWTGGCGSVEHPGDGGHGGRLSEFGTMPPGFIQAARSNKTVTTKGDKVVEFADGQKFSDQQNPHHERDGTVLDSVGDTVIQRTSAHETVNQLSQRHRPKNRWLFTLSGSPSSWKRGRIRRSRSNAPSSGMRQSTTSAPLAESEKMDTVSHAHRLARIQSCRALANHVLLHEKRLINIVSAYEIAKTSPEGPEKDHPVRREHASVFPSLRGPVSVHR